MKYIIWNCTGSSNKQYWSHMFIWNNTKYFFKNYLFDATESNKNANFMHNVAYFYTSFMEIIYSWEFFRTWEYVNSE